MSFWFFQFLPKKRTKTKQGIIVVKLKFFVRSGKLRISKSPFEINWPLGEGLNILGKCVEESLNVTFFVLKIKLDTKHYVKRTIHMCTTCGTANASSKVLVSYPFFRFFIKAKIWWQFLCDLYDLYKSWT